MDAADERLPADSLGLLALVPATHGGGGGASTADDLSASEIAADALVQHLKIFLLFAVLLRHLQRFTVKTCHAWSKVAPTHAAVCIANNVLQTGAVEGLAFLSGVAMAGRVLTWREVASPLVLIIAFRQLLHPTLEWLIAYRTDIGTAHLWFVLMLAVGRLVCLPLSRLHLWAPAHWPPARASRLRLVLVACFLAWRLLLAPRHIGWHAYPNVRRPLYFFFYGDRNYLQMVHNLPLFLLGFIHPDIRQYARARLLASARARRMLAATSSSWVRHMRTALVSSVAAASFVADPLLGGLFNRKNKTLEARPVLAYTRAAMRIGALAVVLPRHRTPITSAGRSQLLAYLLHDAVFSVGAQVIAPALPSLSERLHTLAQHTLRGVSGASDEISVGGAMLIAVLAAMELAIYSACCLAIQLALSHPRCLRPLGALCRLPDWVWRKGASCTRSAYARARLAVRERLHRLGARGRAAHKREAAGEAPEEV